ncbi:hypothetical protein HID58_070413 [Brassica napus]|uniref:Uncharacterized protein n=1 Tax=Brassica napus TaxID=3708 RepID=A0ABQ7YYU7_BRANA|nr:hypothetical protein HID58_070413 [Brassica napus]
MSKSEAMNKKKDYCEEERCRNEEEESAMKKKRDGAKKSEVMAKKMKLNSSASAVAEPAGSSSSSEVPIENQGPCSNSGSESGEPELRSSDPQGVDAEKLVVLTDEPLREASPETDVNPEVDVLATPTVAGLRKWWRMVRKYNVEKWGQEPQDRDHTLELSKKCKLIHMDVYYAGNYSGWHVKPEVGNQYNVNVTIDGPVDPVMVALYEQNDKHSSALE